MEKGFLSVAWKLLWYWLAILGLAAPCLAATAQADSLPPPDYQFQFTPRALDWQPFKVWRGLMIVDVELDGHVVPALIDTGASWTTIVEDLDPRAGTGFSIDAIGGKAAAQSRRYGALKLGGVLVLNGWTLRVSTASMGNVPFRMVLGADIIGFYALQVDWAHHRLRFLAPGDTPPDLPAWPIKQERADPGDPGKGTMFTTAVTLCGKTLRGALDTGADTNMTLLAPAVPPSCSASLDYDVMSWGLAGSDRNEIRAYPSLAVGSQSLGALPVQQARSQAGLGFDKIDASIGDQLLRRFNYTLDSTAGRLVFWGRGDAGPTDDVMTTGVQLDISITTRAVIAHVVRNSPAAAAGLKAGDAICAVDGQRVADINEGVITRIATPTAGSRVDFSLCDGRDIAVEAHDYLGQAAALAAVPMPLERKPTAWLTEAMIACNPDVGKKADVCRNILNAAQPSEGMKFGAATWLARNLIVRREYGAAADAASRAIALQPDNAAAYLLHAETLMDADRYSDALPDTEKALTLAPASPEAQQFQIFDLLAIGRFADGLASARSAIATTSGSWWANSYAAYALCRLGRYDEAKPLAVKAMALGPKAAETWAVEALLAKADGNDAQATTDIEQALKLDPDNPLAVAAKAALSPTAKTPIIH